MKITHRQESPSTPQANDGHSFGYEDYRVEYAHLVCKHSFMLLIIPNIKFMKKSQVYIIALYILYIHIYNNT